MKPIGPLMREHRLIEKVILSMRHELDRTKQTQNVNTDFFRKTADFCRTYADRTHHGKEEDILFKALANKNLAVQHKQTMDELVQEHILGRSLVADLARATDQWESGDHAALGLLLTSASEICRFYPQHIEKEDKHFFYPILEYFSVDEQNSMLRDFWEFDRQLIHEKYQKVSQELENMTR